jgi:SET domain-containing protein
MAERFFNPPSTIKGRAVLEQSDAVIIKRIPGKGRGVFARRRIAKGTLIERVPVLVVPVKDIVTGLKNPVLAKFSFIRSDTTLAIALGYGSLYNHSYRPNAEYDDGPAATMYFTALRDIKPGEEITINYNGVPTDRSPVGFAVVEGAGRNGQLHKPGGGNHAPRHTNHRRRTRRTQLG